MMLATPRPDVPVSSSEPDLVGGAWFGMVGPARLPEPIVSRLHRLIIDSLQEPEMRADFTRTGVERIGSTPAAFVDFIRRETARWGRIARENNIRAD